MDGGRVTIRVDDGELVAVKRAGPDGAKRLVAEAARIRAARHPGVVELLDVDDGSSHPDGVATLRTRLAGSATLATRRLGPGQLADLGATLTATLADLHGRGIVHGRLTPDHVVVAPGTRPVLCGFGDGLGADGHPRTVADDLTALRTLLDGLRGPTDPDDRGVGAPPPGRARPRLALAVLAGGAAVIGTAAGATLLGADRPGPDPTPTCPAVAADGSAPTVGVADVDGDGCPEELRWHDGTLDASGRRFALGHPGDQVVVADWDCDGAATPALARGADGAVFTFARWAGAGDDVVAEPIGHLAPRAELVVPPGGCGAPLQRLGDDTSPLAPPVQEVDR